MRVECPISFADVDVLPLLDGIRMNSLPGWAKEEPGAPVRIFLASSSELRDDRDESTATSAVPDRGGSWRLSVGKILWMRCLKLACKTSTTAR